MFPGHRFYGMFEWVQRARPPIVILENVCGAPWKGMVQNFASAGYHATHTRLDTKFFYLPQTRTRGYLLARRRRPPRRGRASGRTARSSRDPSESRRRSPPRSRCPRSSTRGSRRSAASSGARPRRSRTSCATRRHGDPVSFAFFFKSRSGRGPNRARRDLGTRGSEVSRSGRARRPQGRTR